MKTYIFLGVFCAAASVSASSPNLADALNSSSCRTNVMKIMPKSLVKQTWVPQVISNPGERLQSGVAFRDTRVMKVYRVWVRKELTHFAEADLKTGNERLTIWDAKSQCEGQSVARKLEFPQLPNTSGFTDGDLHRLLKSRPAGLIYVWSPYMPLSVDAIKEIRTAAKQENLPLTILLDGTADPDEAREWVKLSQATEADLVQVASHELYARVVNLHYPILFYYKQGFLSNRTYIGHKTSAVYRNWIKFESAQLSKDLQ